MDKVDNVHDHFFKKVFANEENVRSFLQIALPQKILNELDLSRITLDMTGYVSDKLKGYFSDIVAQTMMKSESQGKIETDIYFLFEHKSYEDPQVMIQILKYMYYTWQKDTDEGKQLRVIVPIVFYHGEKKWSIPTSFHDQFNISKEVKKFLLDFKYILFDTNTWDFHEPGNEALGDNVFLLTAMLLFKSAYHDDTETIQRVLAFWQKSGLHKDRERLLFFLTYIVATQEISPDELGKMLTESQMNGGDIMPTLAQRWVKEGKKLEKVKIAKKLIKKGIDLNIIAESTGLSRQEVEKMALQG